MSFDCIPKINTATRLPFLCAVIDLTSGNGNLKRVPEKVYGIAGNWMKSEIIGGFFLCNKAMKEMQALKFYQ